MRLGHPVEYQIGPATAKDTREPNDSCDPSVSLAKAPCRNHLNTETGIDQLVRPWPRFEEHELQLMPGLLHSVEHGLQHRLGGTAPLPPWHSYEYAHWTPLTRSEEHTSELQSL